MNILRVAILAMCAVLAIMGVAGAEPPLMVL